MNDENTNGQGAGKDLLKLIALVAGVIVFAAMAVKALETFF